MPTLNISALLCTYRGLMSDAGGPVVLAAIIEAAGRETAARIQADAADRQTAALQNIAEALAQ